MDGAVAVVDLPASAALGWLLPLSGASVMFIGLVLLIGPDSDGPLAAAVVLVALIVGLAGGFMWFLSSFATPARMRWIQPDYFWEAVEEDP